MACVLCSLYSVVYRALMIFNFSKEYKFAIMPLLFFGKNVCILASAILLLLFLFMGGINGLPGGFECALLLIAAVTTPSSLFLQKIVIELQLLVFAWYRNSETGGC